MARERAEPLWVCRCGCVVVGVSFHCLSVCRRVRVANLTVKLGPVKRPMATSISGEAVAEDDDDLADLCAAHPAPSPRSCGLAIARVPFDQVGEHFFDHFVGKRQPVILTGCVEHWPALARWNHAYLSDTLGATPVHVARTPDGLADAVTNNHASGEPIFAKAFENPMPFDSFIAMIETPLEGRSVHYCSHQNDSLTTEFGALWDDVETSLHWADAAFGRPPAATNFWMGEDAAHTTAHADLFDNLYVVCTGEKSFTLLPPQDGHQLQRRAYRAGTYRVDASESDRLVLELDEPPTLVHWTALDLETAETLQPLRATVRPGEILYLPALWWHAVSQHGSAEGSTTAVNYWYEGPVALGDEADAAAEKAADRILASLKGDS